MNYLVKAVTALKRQGLTEETIIAAVRDIFRQQEAKGAK